MDQTAILRMYRRGLKVSAIAEMSGLPVSRVNYLVAPEARRQRSEWLKAERQGRGIKPAARRVVPAVTRPRHEPEAGNPGRPYGLTANLMGDPAYSRSALAARQRGAQEISLEG